MHHKLALRALGDATSLVYNMIKWNKEGDEISRSGFSLAQICSIHVRGRVFWSRSQKGRRIYYRAKKVEMSDILDSHGLLLLFYSNIKHQRYCQLFQIVTMSLLVMEHYVLIKARFFQCLTSG